MIDTLSVLVAGTLALLIAWSMWTATRPPLVLPEPTPHILPDLAAEQLIDALCRGSRIQAAILAGDVTVSARWVCDLQDRHSGTWRVQVGEHVGWGRDLSEVYGLVRSRLQAIIDERRSGRGGRAA